MLAQPELQEPLLNWFLKLLRCDSESSEKVRVRWKWAIDRSLISSLPMLTTALEFNWSIMSG